MSHLDADSIDVRSLLLHGSHAAMFAEDWDAFRDWMGRHWHTYVPDRLATHPTARAHLPTALARSIWGALPINAHGRAPCRASPTAAEVRGFRGSAGSSIPTSRAKGVIWPLSRDDLWPYVLANLSVSRRAKVAKRYFLSGRVALECADILMWQGSWIDVAEFCESCLASPEVFHDKYAVGLLQMFFLAGVSLRWPYRVRGVLMQLLDRAPASPLRSCTRMCLGIDLFLTGTSVGSREVVLELQADDEGAAILNALDALWADRGGSTAFVEEPRGLNALSLGHGEMTSVLGPGPSFRSLPHDAQRFARIVQASTRVDSVTGVPDKN